jgi:hypothetical protein
MHYHQSTPLAISLFLKLDSAKNLVSVDDPLGALNDYNAEVAAMQAEGAAEQAEQDALPISQQNADFAEWYSKVSTEVIEPGDIVSVGYMGTVTKATSPYDQKILGIMSTSPFMTSGKKVHDDDIRLALNGRVPTKVSLENGPIEPGDYLTSSSIPGVAMKATRPGQVVGKALASFDGTNSEVCAGNNPNFSSEVKCGKILVFLNLTFADPGNFFASLSLDDEGNLIVPKLKVGQLTLDKSIIPTFDSSPLSQGVENPQTDMAVKLAELEERIKVLEASVQFTGNSVQEATPSAQLADSNEATASGELALEPVDILLATESATLANLNVTENLSSEKLLTALDLTVSGIFKNLGQAILGATTIAGDLTIDGTFSITDGSRINAFPTLYIQDSVLSEKVDFFNGLVTIDKTGLVSMETLAIGNSSLGEAEILAGSTDVTINSTAITTSSKIFVTPTSDLEGNLVISSQGSGTFKVKVTKPNLNKVKFNWFILQHKASIN